MGKVEIRKPGKEVFETNKKTNNRNRDWVKRRTK